MKKYANAVVLFLGFFFILLGGAFYYYEKNPQVYNTLAEAGVNTNILDGLGKWEGELKDGEYYTFVDSKGQELDQTVHHVFIGDELILEDNNRYKVTRVDEGEMKAICSLVGRENTAYLEEWDHLPVDLLAQNKKTVGIYMTHNNESYVPTDGTESKRGDGGIMRVGMKLGEALKNNGVNAVVSDNKHDPHDANAYHRSRKTAVQLIRNNPAVLLDVHRDGISDPKFYHLKTDSNDATKIRLVVGRQNPHMSTNLEFAKQVKAYFDKNYPGLIKGIFIAKGNYNQDLGPRALLLEVGTYTNKREAAEMGAAIFGNGLPRLIGTAGAGGGPQGAVPSAGAARSLAWLLAFVVVGGAAFLLISTGSLKVSLDRISGLGKEFSNYFGPSRFKKKKDNDDEAGKD